MTIGAKLDEKIRRMSQGLRIVQDLRERVRKDGKLELEGDVIFEEHVFLETDGPACEVSGPFKSCDEASHPGMRSAGGPAPDAKLGQDGAPRRAVECCSAPGPLVDLHAQDANRHLRLDCYRATVPMVGTNDARLDAAKKLYAWVTSR